jgi:hypothetical protein
MIRRLRLIPATLVLSGVFSPHVQVHRRLTDLSRISRPEAKHRRCRAHPIHPPSGRKR